METGCPQQITFSSNTTCLNPDNNGSLNKIDTCWSAHFRTSAQQENFTVLAALITSLVFPHTTPLFFFNNHFHHILHYQRPSLWCFVGKMFIEVELQSIASSFVWLPPWLQLPQQKTLENKYPFSFYLSTLANNCDQWKLRKCSNYSN